MPETRTYDPSEGEGLAKLVRDALGENIRPSEPGTHDADDAIDDDEDLEEDDGTASLTDLPDFEF